ncbi:MAG: hydantoinase B/oxoprolinase family protein [Xanthomonadales bacterium]|nr:hydantoinase B/oxoprolinase family protein [Xanthomonadales bacterium]
MSGPEKFTPSGIELGLYSNRVDALCEEMGSLLGRVALSPNIRDRLDYSCALFDVYGRLLGQATHIPVHLGSMAFAMADVVQKFDWQPGDSVVFNDPFKGGTHLPDVTFVSPVFYAGKLSGFVANRAHHADIGSETPGSMPVTRSLSEEGIIIAPTRLVRSGVLDESWLSALCGKLNDVQASRGDFAAQLAANRLGCRRLEALLEEYGFERCQELAVALQDYGRRMALISLGEIPRGRYRFGDVLDDDGFGHRDISLEVCVNADENGVTVDFDGTAGQVEGNLNCPLPVTAAAVAYVFRCLMPPQTPSCHGALAAVGINAPAGTLVNANAPAAVAAGNVETSMRIVDAVCGALAQALPGKIPAASQGTMNNLAMGCRGKHSWDYYETLAGGHGAGIDFDGRSARHSHMTNTLNTPVEVLERHYPMRIEQYSIRRGSGGQGRHHGGDGIVREYRFLENAELSILSERRWHAPWGLEGGRAGKPGLNLLDGDDLGSKCQLQVKAGQLLRIETPGGGGYG